MATRYALNDVPDQHMLACAAKLVAMMIHAREGDDAFTCLFSIQGSIEVFAAQAATPIEQVLAESLRAMSAEMMRRSQGHVHSHAVSARAFVSHSTRHTVRFKRTPKANA